LTTNFDTAFNYLVSVDEGTKYTNNPSDSGGPTKYGITKRTYQNFYDALVLDSEIENMTAATAKQIYRVDYWSPLRCEEIIPLAFAVAFFDCGVLYGVKTTALLIQRALSLCSATLKLDGILGDKSIGFINSIGGGSNVLRSSLAHSFYGLLLSHIDDVITANPKNEVFRQGWINRADRILKILEDPIYLNTFTAMEII
jgi:lysozyme family protein